MPDNRERTGGSRVTSSSATGGEQKASEPGVSSADDVRTSGDAPSAEAQVLHLPHFDSNPYQKNLAEALEARGVSVTLASGYPLETMRTVASEGIPDVLHLHWISPYLVGDGRLRSAAKAAVFLAGLFVARLLGVRIVWTAHNLVEHERRHPTFERFCKRFLVRRVFDRVFVHWSSARLRLVEEYGLSGEERADLVTIPHGHYVEDYENDIDRETARNRLGLSDDAFVFLYFGRIRPYKQVPALVEAFGRLDAADARLVVAGNATDDELHERVASRAAADDRVRSVLEYIPDDEVQTYMNAADAVVFPFRDIFTSGSVLLAMSFGKAVVAPESGCLPDVVGESGGVLYDPDDPVGLPTAIRKALSRDVAWMGRRNYETAVGYSWDDVAERTAAAYAELLDSR
ncbi:glycosyltransferase [Halorussus sp. MSC15.2]|uniref:glycosyltransferase n=1 Tax=Halorussus sp. MSC15.2 TaxID=2283638 RepID=UPI0013D2B6F4|nr:glycosyltransferase [Halorussus sp. MSC15.2]NEU58098.1 glycosyltransferase [Halorussus sp. MSC15.2]